MIKGICDDCAYRDLELNELQCAKCYNCEEFVAASETDKAVNHPSHYNREGAMECIDEMLLIYGRQAVIDFCILSAYKYRYRAGQKDGEAAIKDMQKSDWYIAKVAEMRGMKE